MIQFYGAPMSSSGRTHWMLEEVGVPFEYHRVALRDPAAMAAYRDVNPSGKVPFVIDGDVRLCESIAINFYLAERYKPEMWSSDPLERAELYQWSLWGITNVQPPALEVMFSMMQPATANAAKVAEHKARCQALLDHLETRIGDRFVVGDRFTVADVNLASNVNLALRTNAATGGPKTVAWMESMRARPAYAKIAKAG
jgi:glutathione S-transferase